MSGMVTPPPIYDRRRLEQLVTEHKLRVYLARKKHGKHPMDMSGVKAPR